MQQPPDDDDKKPVPQLGSLTAPPERPDLKKRIMESKQKLLNNIKGKFTGEETGRWLDNIDQSPSRADEAIGPGSLIDESQLSMPAFIDMLFDHLQRYVFEYNKIPSNQDNVLNCERPHGYQERAEYGAQSSRVKYMRGHLSSRTWSLVVDALDEEISLYIVPTEFLIGFEPTHEFQPYLTIDKEMGMTSVMWSIGGKRLGVEELTRFARKLITHLVKVIKGEAPSTEKFSFSPNENRFEEPVTPDRSFEQIPESDGLHPGIQQASMRAMPGVPPAMLNPAMLNPPMPAIPETRSGMLKRLMEVAQQEEQEARTVAMSGVRQLTSRTAAAAAPTGVAQKLPSQTQTLPKPPGALGAAGAAPAMPAPPGAFGQGGNGPGMPIAPGAIANVGVQSGGTPPYPTPLAIPPAGAPGAPSAPTPPSFPMPPGAFGAPPAQSTPPQSTPQNSGGPAPAAPPITAPGGFGAALSALGSLVPQTPAAPASNELSRILEMPVTSETGPLPVPPGAQAQGTPMQGIPMQAPQPLQGGPPMPPEGLGFVPPGGFGQIPRPAQPSQTSTGGHPPVAPVAPLMPANFLAPPPEVLRPAAPPESNHADEEPDGALPPTPSGAWDFSMPSGSAVSAGAPAPSLPPPPAPPVPPAPQMPPQMQPQMAPPVAPQGVAPQAPPMISSAPLPAPSLSPVLAAVPPGTSAPAPAPEAPHVVAGQNNAEPAASRVPSRGVSALFDEDDNDEPLAEIIEAPAPQPAPAPTGRGLAGLVRRDSAPKPPSDAPVSLETASSQETPEATVAPRSLREAVTSAIRSAEEPAPADSGDRAKRPTLQSLLSSSDSGEPAPVTIPEPKIQPVPPAMGLLGLPVGQPGATAAAAPQPQAAQAPAPQAPPVQPAPSSQLTPLPTPAPQPTQPAATQAMTTPPSPPPSQPVTFSSGDPAELARQVDDAQRQAVEGCNRIVSELDNALKGLQEAGARAMQEGNFEAVTKVMEQANRLKGVRERMAQLTQEISSV